MATKKLNEVTQVTSVTTNHRVVLTDNNGNVSRITPANLHEHMLGGRPVEALDEGVMVAAISLLQNSKGSLKSYTVSAWKNLSASNKSGLVAVGVMIPMGLRHIVVAVDEDKMLWASANTSGGQYQISKWDALSAHDGMAYTTQARTGGTCLATDYCLTYEKVALASDSSMVGIEAGLWHLPTASELMLIYENLAKVNYALSAIDGATQIGTAFHWSSVERSDSNVWVVNFAEGQAVSTGKTAAGNATFRVRPVFTFG